MNIEDEIEFERFYDFSKTYEGHSLSIKQDKCAKKPEQSESKNDESEDEWEEVDEEDANEEESS